MAQACREAGHQVRRRDRRLHVSRAARRDVQVHGRRERGPQGLHGGLLPEDLRSAPRAGPRDARVPREGDGRLDRDHDSPHPRPQRLGRGDRRDDALDRGPARAGRAPSLHRVSSGLEDARPARDAARDAAAARATIARANGLALGLHRERLRPRRDRARSAPTAGRRSSAATATRSSSWDLDAGRPVPRVRRPLPGHSSKKSPVPGARGGGPSTLGRNEPAPGSHRPPWRGRSIRPVRQSWSGWSTICSRARPSRTSAPSPAALVVPHAGYVYSGPVAATAYARLSGTAASISRVVAFGPVHYVPVRGAAVPAARAWATPLGEVPIDRRPPRAGRGARCARSTTGRTPPSTRSRCSSRSCSASSAKASRSCPSPSRSCRPRRRPISSGSSSARTGTLVLVSTDLSHYHDLATARRLDRHTADAILARDAVGALGRRRLRLLSAEGPRGAGPEKEPPDRAPRPQDLRRHRRRPGARRRLRRVRGGSLLRP